MDDSGKMATLAIKAIKRPGLNPQELQRTQLEVRILEAVKGHPNVVALDAHYWFQGNFFLVFQFVAGDLDHVLEAARGGLPEPTVRLIARQLVSAVGEGWLYTNSNS